MDRFQLPADAHPVSLDCNECNTSIVFNHEDAACLEEYSHCTDCHQLLDADLLLSSDLEFQDWIQVRKAEALTHFDVANDVSISPEAA